MKQKTIDYLSKNQGRTTSKWRENAEWRRDNARWLRYTQHIAVLLLTYMKNENLTRQDIADKLCCTQDYVSKVLKGEANITIEMISNIEQILNVQLVNL